MTQDDINKIKEQLVYLRNTNILLTTLFMPVDELIKQHPTMTETEAIEKKDKTYDFLKKYANKYLTTASTVIKEIVDKEEVYIYDNT